MIYIIYDIVWGLRPDEASNGLPDYVELDKSFYSINGAIYHLEEIYNCHILSYKYEVC